MDDDPQTFTEDFPEMSDIDRNSPTPTVEDEVKVDSIVQDELASWLDLSRSLRQFGLQPNFDKIKAAPEALPFLLLTTSQSRSLRDVVQMLMTDCDRRQTLLQDIMTVNNEMKSEMKRQTEVAQRYERKAKDLKMMLESSRQRLQEISEEKALSQGVSNVEVDRQRNTKEAAMTKARQLEKRCEQQEEEILRLRRKVSKMAQEDSDRQERQRELFHRLKRRPASRKPSPLDDKVLDIIDSYEHQVQSLRRQRDLLGGEDVMEEDEEDKERSVSVNYQKLVKDLQRKLKTATDALSAMEEEKELLKLDLDSRPSVRDFNNSQIRLRRYEKLLRQNNIDIRAETRSDRSGRPPVFSTDVGDLDLLPLQQCRDLLRGVSQELNVSNLDSLVLTAKDLRRASREVPNLADFLRSVEKLVNSPSAPPLSVAFTTARQGEECDVDSTNSSSRGEPAHHRHLLSVLEFWLDQLSALPELRASLLRIYSHIFPWRSQPPAVGPEVCAMVGLVDSMMEREPDVVQTKEVTLQCPQNVAQGLVSHFQRLFDCPRLSAVYTRMNDVYAKLGELRTLFANIRQTLDLDPNTSPAQVFDAVTNICRAQADANEFELEQKFGADNLTKALEKLEQYDDFFPTFRKLVDDLLHLLDLDHIDRILPAVRSLKHCVDLQ